MTAWTQEELSQKQSAVNRARIVATLRELSSRIESDLEIDARLTIEYAWEDDPQRSAQGIYPAKVLDTETILITITRT